MILERKVRQAGYELETVYRDERWPGEWLTRTEITAREVKIIPAHISSLVPGQPGSIAEKVATEIGITIAPVSYNDREGFVVNGKYPDGVMRDAAVFSDSTSPADQLLFALIKELQK